MEEWAALLVGGAVLIAGAVTLYFVLPRDKEDDVSTLGIAAALAVLLVGLVFAGSGLTGVILRVVSADRIPRNRDRLVEAITNYEHAVNQALTSAWMIEKYLDNKGDSNSIDPAKMQAFVGARHNLEAQIRVAGRNFETWLTAYVNVLAGGVWEYRVPHQPMGDDAYYRFAIESREHTSQILAALDAGTLYLPPPRHKRQQARQ
jgi:hypothetical protein